MSLALGLCKCLHQLYVPHKHVLVHSVRSGIALVNLQGMLNAGCMEYYRKAVIRGLAGPSYLRASLYYFITVGIRHDTSQHENDRLHVGTDHTVKLVKVYLLT